MKNKREEKEEKEKNITVCMSHSHTQKYSDSASAIISNNAEYTSRYQLVDELFKCCRSHAS